MLAAVRVTPCVTTAGIVTPTGPSPTSSAKLSTIAFTTRATAWGVDSPGVGMRRRSVASSPLARSTIAPLMPEPPMSIPRTC